MKRYRVEFSPEAVSHVEAIGAWWTANRPTAPLLFTEELRAALRQLQRSPHSGLLYRRRSVPPTRRIVLPKSRHHVYYLADDESRVVRIYAVWHMARGHAPGTPT